MTSATINENGGALPEGTATAVSATDTGSIRISDSVEDKAARNRRAIAAFYTTMFLDDLVGAIREKRMLARQREADGNPSEVDLC